MKNVVIIGANGRSAREAAARITNQPDVALTLFLRRPERVADLAAPNTRIVAGDARDDEALAAALEGQDIMVIALGGSDLDRTTAAIVRAGVRAGVNRIITINAGGIYGELPEPFNTWDLNQIGDTRSIMRRAADVVENSGLQYTVLRPVWLTDKPVLEVEITSKGEPFKGTETSRASLGAIIAEIIQNPNTHLDASIGITQPGTDGDKPAAYR